ncbi:MAG TPA: AraC family transcriptional regulator [Luteolibacter sp.]|nr:AraC family transcriptional regulator [Luteolibacter sp.]
MQIIRGPSSWLILGVARTRHSLEELAFRNGYRVEAICHEIGCGIRYFHFVFLRDIGLPPKRWMRYERMVVARRMLFGGRSPDEVAERVGFAGTNNFNREFTAIYRMTPRQFIELTRSLQGDPEKKAS